MAEAEVLYERALAAMRTNRHERARELLMDTLRADPTSDSAWVWLARLTEAREHKEKCLRRALLFNPGNEEAQTMLQRLLEDDPVARAEAPLYIRRREDETWSSGIGQVLLRDGTAYRGRTGEMLAALAAALLAGGLFYGFVVSSPVDHVARPLLLAGALAALLAALLALWRLTAPTQTLVIHENGITHIHRGQIRRWYWQQFDEIVVHDPAEKGRPSLRGYRVELRAGGRTLLGINGRYYHHRELGQMVLQQSGPVFVKRCMLIYRRGQPIRFGHIRLDNEGIRWGWHELPWNRIQMYDLRPGALLFTRIDGRVLRLSTAGLPNAHVLVLLVKQFYGYHQSAVPGFTRPLTPEYSA